MLSLAAGMEEGCGGCGLGRRLIGVDKPAGVPVHPTGGYRCVMDLCAAATLQ